MSTNSRNPAIEQYPNQYRSVADPSPVTEAATSSIATIGFAFNLIYTFLLFSRSIEFIDTTGKIHLAIITGGVCILAALATGAIPRMLISKQGQWITLFSFWIFVGLPFSSWKGGSVHEFTSIWLKTYVAFFLVGGLIFTLAQFRKMILVLAIGACCQIYLAFHASLEGLDNRISVAYGTLGNANDLASALLMGLPIIVYIMTSKAYSIVFRGLLLIPAVLLVVVVMKTGSRGGLIAAFVLGIVTFFSSSAVNKMKLFVVALVAVGLFAVAVPKEVRGRYMTILKSTRDANTTDNAASAMESSNARSELLRHSLILTKRHPIFGVGLAQFAPQSADLFIAEGQSALWFTSHDIYGLISSEVGLPGLIFYLVLIFVCFRDLYRLSKISTQTPELQSIANMAYCLMLSLVTFVICGIFSTAAYTFQLPLIAALTAALIRIAKPYVVAIAPVPQAPAFVPFINRKLLPTPVRTGS